MNASGRDGTGGPLAGLLELAILAASYLAFLWLLLPRYRDPAAQATILALSAVGTAWVVAVSPRLLHRDAPEALGVGPGRTLWIRLDNLAPAALGLALVAAAGSSVLLCLGWLLWPSRLAAITVTGFLRQLGAYLPLALVQDISLAFALVRLDAMATAIGARRGREAVAGTAAALFALLHAPNVPVMALSGAFVLVAGRVFLTRPNLLALVLCHAWTGAVLRSATDLNTRVGPFATQPDVRVAREIAASLADLLVRASGLR